MDTIFGTIECPNCGNRFHQKHNDHQKCCGCGSVFGLSIKDSDSVEEKDE